MANQLKMAMVNAIWTLKQRGLSNRRIARGAWYRPKNSLSQVKIIRHRIITLLDIYVSLMTHNGSRMTQ